MQSIPELQAVSAEAMPVLSGRANELVQQIEQVFESIHVRFGPCTDVLPKPVVCANTPHVLTILAEASEDLFTVKLAGMQAALQPVHSAEKLELVEQLTDYVSDALAEVLSGTRRLPVASGFLNTFLTSCPCHLMQGSLADGELQYIFQARKLS